MAGGDTEGPWYMPDILVNYRRSGDDPIMGVIREVLPVRVCKSFSHYLVFIYFELHIWKPPV